MDLIYVDLHLQFDLHVQLIVVKRNLSAVKRCTSDVFGHFASGQRRPGFFLAGWMLNIRQNAFYGVLAQASKKNNNADRYMSAPSGF